MNKTKMKQRTSPYYVGTTTDRNDPDLISLKQKVKSQHPTKRVVIRGRKPIVKVNGKGYTWGGNVVLGLDNATMFDVYIYSKSY